ncbi:MAG: VPLPA-CTERM-specific exosortase XrtD [Chromatiales bacterium]|nr:VPLPA-CTERM-specific exosortase XrtD [Chromatiales bacterium]
MANGDHNTIDLSRQNWSWLLLPILIFVSTLVLFRDGLGLMVTWWETKPEYNHGYLIPVVAAYLLLLRADVFRTADIRSSWGGLGLLIFGLMFLVLGNLSAVYVITQYAFLITLVGLVVIAYGWKGAWILWAPIAYLFFMIPLPNFLYDNLSNELQLMSSETGVGFLRMAGISVFLEGNVIDLGEFKLQVAEACSGLRYLFPLMSFGFLCAFLFRGAVWQKAIIFLSSIPITLLMNSFRIGVIGLLVEHYGISMARGFLHDFEGWIIFMACVGILFFEMWLFALFSKRPLADIFDVRVPPMSDFVVFMPRIRPSVYNAGLLGLFLILSIFTFTYQSSDEFVPERSQLSTFPLALNEWRGQEQGMAQQFIENLELDDYLMARFVREGDPASVELYIAYYESQRKGASVHSPRACLPGGGWTIESFDEYPVTNVGPELATVNVNRAVISLGTSRQLVYYWFQQRGRNITNEYLVKWFIFWDSLTKNRTDGALVRLVTAVPESMDMGEADERMQEFIRDIDPTLAYFIPRGIGES